MNERPKVLLCSFELLPAPTGTSRRATGHLRALAGRASVVVTCEKPPDAPHVERYVEARLLRVPTGGGDLASRAHSFERALRRQLESESFEIIHCPDPFAGWIIAELREEYGHKLVFEAASLPSLDLHERFPEVEDDRRLLARVRRQELYCLMSADAVVVPTRAARTHVQRLGVPPDQIHVLRTPSGVPTPRSLPSRDTSGPLRLAYLGSQLPHQGLEVLFRAIASMAAALRPHLELMGPRHPHWTPRLERLAVSLGLEANVTYSGVLEVGEIARRLAAAELGVAPSRADERARSHGGGLAKLSDYLAAGLPILASDLPATRELIPDEVGLFFEPGNVEALTALLDRVGRERASLEPRGRAALDEARRSVSSAPIEAAVRALYESLLGRALEPESPTSSEPTRTITGTPTGRVDERSDGRVDGRLGGREESSGPSSSTSDEAHRAPTLTGPRPSRSSDDDRTPTQPSARLRPSDRSDGETILVPSGAARGTAEGLRPLTGAQPPRSAPPPLPARPRPAQASPPLDEPVVMVEPFEDPDEPCDELTDDDLVLVEEAAPPAPAVAHPPRTELWASFVWHGFRPGRSQAPPAPTPPTNFPGRG